MDNIVEKNCIPNGVQSTITQAATASVSQEQSVAQQNTNAQEYAIAVALDGACALAVQYSNQTNSNIQQGSAEAENEVDNTANGDLENSIQCLPSCNCCCPDITQSATATVDQAQTVSQANVNAQTAAIAVADGEGSEAIAAQVSEQTNTSSQVGQATAENSVGDNDAANSNSNVAVRLDQNDASEPVVQVKENKETGDIKDKKEGVYKALKEQVEGILDKAMKIALKVDKNSGTIEINADENGAVTVEEKSAAASDAANVDIKTAQKGKGNVTVTISQNEKNMEIKTDANGDIYVNGEKIELKG